MCVGVGVVEARHKGNIGFAGVPCKRFHSDDWSATLSLCEANLKTTV